MIATSLVERFLPLARQLARRYQGGSEPLEDLEQVASLALVRAVDGFDPTRGTAFSSYAVPSIAGAIKRHFRDHGWSVRVPRELQELSLRVERLSRELDTATGRPPSTAEVAASAGVDVEQVVAARVAYARFTPIRSIHHGARTRTMTATRCSTRWEAPTRTSTACSSNPSWTP